MSCSEKDLDEADAENPAENDVVERLSDFYSENDSENCLKNDLKPSRAHVLSEEDIELDEGGPDDCVDVDALPSVKSDSLAEDAKAEADEEEKVVLVEKYVSA